MSNSDEYASDHRLAKIITCSIIILLLWPSLSVRELLAIIVWIFHINTAQYIIEILRKHKHKVRIW